jgi:hypothetical protein
MSKDKNRRAKKTEIKGYQSVGRSAINMIGGSVAEKPYFCCLGEHIIPIEWPV